MTEIQSTSVAFDAGLSGYLFIVLKLNLYCVRQDAHLPLYNVFDMCSDQILRAAFISLNGYKIKSLKFNLVIVNQLNMKPSVKLLVAISRDKVMQCFIVPAKCASSRKCN